jgi:hypothetical protein
MAISPLQLSFYKGLSGKHGVLQFNLQKPHYYCTKCKNKDFYSGLPLKDKTCKTQGECDFKSREGALFLEITSAIGKNVYDWDHKIVIALSITDMGKILMVLEGLEPECKILHDPGANSPTKGKIPKTLTFSSPQGIKQGCLVNIRENRAGGEEAVKHMVPLSGDEVRVLGACLRHVIPTALGW